MDVIPEKFGAQAPVPGLVDMAFPPFSGVGFENPDRTAFWYKRTFQVEGEIPAYAKLKLHKAKYGTKVFLNGQLVGEHLPSFTPMLFDVKPFLKGNGEPNEILIRVGAHRTVLPDSIPGGWDFEKFKYIPGIYDDVELILAGNPRIANIQTVPELQNKAIKVVTWVESTEKIKSKVIYTIREVSTGKTVAQGEVEINLKPNKVQQYDTRIKISDPHLWSPEDPFLYQLEAQTPGETVKVNFGMRSFGFDKESGRAMLNGKPYYMRGTNVCIYRFFEDEERKYRPWDKTWVKRLHKKFKSMNWNTIRYCIGFPPDFWYDIADELGFLIQDEFPIWHGAPDWNNGDGIGKWPEALTHRQLTREYTDWMEERWNHACVVIWDSQNETVTNQTGKAVKAVRSLDLSNRPWENGWDIPQADTDPREAHPYLFISEWAGHEPFQLSKLPKIPGRPELQGGQERDDVPIIINEYAWLWLSRDGTTTSLTQEVYASLVGEQASNSVRRYHYARHLAALTEFWRARRECAGVLHFCGLAYSRPGGLVRPVAGATSDHFTELEGLNFEPNFEKYVKDAFAPVGIMIDAWKELYDPGQSTEIPVVIINDLDRKWSGTIKLSIRKEGGVLTELKTSGAGADEYELERVTFNFDMPNDPGEYTLVAELITEGDESVKSLRDFRVRVQ